jgi:hypothetical protein
MWTGGAIGAKAGQYAWKAASPYVYSAAAKYGSGAVRNYGLAGRLSTELDNAIAKTQLNLPERFVTKSYDLNNDGSISGVFYKLFGTNGKQLGNSYISGPIAESKGGRPVGWIESQNGAHGVTEDLYNVGVKDA